MRPIAASRSRKEVLEHPETAGDPVANAAFSRPAEILTPVIAAVDGPAYAAGFILQTVSATANNQFMVRATGGTIIYSAGDLTAGARGPQNACR